MVSMQYGIKDSENLTVLNRQVLEYFLGFLNLSVLSELHSFTFGITGMIIHYTAKHHHLPFPSRVILVPA